MTPRFSNETTTADSAAPANLFETAGVPNMDARVIDARGMKCPLPALKMMNASMAMKPGEILEVIADCPSFETDVRKFCQARGKALLFVKAEGICKRVQIRI